jgi:hypothetical protein
MLLTRRDMTLWAMALVSKMRNAMTSMTSAMLVALT